jgi:O-antigen/teichoic acid export membrane protein
LSISPTIITAVCINASVEVAIFGLASTVEGYIYTFATAINGMFLPRISKIYADGKKETDLLPLMIKVGRIQFILVGLISVGFIALGKSFIVDIWNKPDFSQSYICAVLLLIPNMFYLPMQIANTAVVVENKVKLQAIIFIVMNVVNIAFSFVFGRLWGAAGVALALLVSYLVRILLMCIVYKRVMHMDIVKFVKEVFIKLSPNMLLTLGVGLLNQCSGIVRIVHGFLAADSHEKEIQHCGGASKNGAQNDGVVKTFQQNEYGQHHRIACQHAQGNVRGFFLDCRADFHRHPSCYSWR